MTVHYFKTSGDAYDASQNGLAANGDLLVVESEQVVGVCDTWPVAVTAESGELHAPRGLASLVKYATERGWGASVEAALAFAAERGWPVAA